MFFDYLEYQNTIMNISLNWLTEYVDVSLPAAELGELFTRIGLNCEGITETPSDIVFDLEVTSNRHDLLGHLGVARELAAAIGVEFRSPAPGKNTTGNDIAALTSVKILDAELCPRYTARVIRNVKVGASPQLLVERLESVGFRSVNNVVDVTNFVLMEYSQPLHAFDYDKLSENRIVVRRAKKGETLVSIDETICQLDENMCIIADADKPIAIAAVMGGLDTEVTTATTNLLIESAQFNPMTTRYTSRKLGIMSESNYRFERCVDPVAVDEASRRACELICELTSGQLVSGVIDVWAKPYEAPVITLRPSRTDKLLGVVTAPERQCEILAGLGLVAQLDGDKITCTIPPYRSDLTREVDLIEEVARLVGYDNLPVGTNVTHRLRPKDDVERIRGAVATALTGAGYDESITFSFIDAADAACFGFDKTVDVDAAVRKTNNTLRPTLLPSLLTAIKNNQDVGNSNVSLFELAAVFPPSKDSPLPNEFTELGMITTDSLRSLRGGLEYTVERIAPRAELTVRPENIAGFEGGVAATILLNDVPAGTIGKINTEVQNRFGVEKPIAAACLRFDILSKFANLTRSARLLPKFPPVCRDLSLILNETVTWGQLAAALDTVVQPLRASEKYVTAYRGKQTPRGKKSVTVALEYRSSEGTLTGELVDEQIEEILTVMRKTFNAELRQ